MSYCSLYLVSKHSALQAAGLRSSLALGRMPPSACQMKLLVYTICHTVLQHVPVCSSTSSFPSNC